MVLLLTPRQQEPQGHGFNPWGPNSGEFISVADKNELWAWELIPDGANW